jgi:hypothetical protein
MRRTVGQLSLKQIAKNSPPASGGRGEGLAPFSRTVEAAFGADRVRPAIEGWIEELESVNWQTSGKLPIGVVFR